MLHILQEIEVCMYVCLYVCMCVYIGNRLFREKLLFVLYILVSRVLSMFVCIHIYTHMAYVYIYIYIYIYICSHTLQHVHSCKSSTQHICIYNVYIYDIILI